MNLIGVSAWLIGALGLGMLIGGIVLMRSPAAFVLAGIGFLSWAYIVDKASVRLQRRGLARGGMR